MAEHHELVAEMSLLESMGTQERQRLAKKRRLQQLKKWSQREKEWIAKEKQMNKKLANRINEENNGLNLKQYTTYSSSHRSKKKLQINSNSAPYSTKVATNGTTPQSNNVINGSGIQTTDNDPLHNNNNDINSLDTARIRAPPNTIDSSLMPNGRVHFEVGVMLLEAAARNDLDELKRLLMLGVSPDSVNHDGLTALHQCCIDASEPIMNLLLESGAKVDARDTEQWTPLHAACTCGHLNLVKILVEHGANLMAVNGDGNMPFDICEDEKTLDYIESQMVKQGITQEMIDFTRASTELQMISDLEKLVADKRDLNSANDSGVTLLHIASSNGYLSALKFLLKQSVNVNVCDNDLWTPLHGAACWGNDQYIKIIELLVENGANLNAKTINDETCFDLCDNVELLDRLNQLKDEMESKQASGGDKLKRTQSRTNSRVHSVRRTSVRDKNQISRREAREEALLRVDSQQLDLEKTNGTTVGKSDHLPSVDNVESPSNGHSGISTSSLSSSEMENVDHIDGVSKVNNLGESDEPSTKKLDISSPSNAVQETTNGSRVSSDHNSNESLVEKRKNLIKQKQIVSSTESSKHTIDNPSATVNHKSVIDLQVNGRQFSVGAKTNIHLNGNANGWSGDSQGITNDLLDENQNPLAQKPPQRETSFVSVAQSVPINYTLSNLKKQRSDLRMRTTSIGGNYSSTTSSNNNSNNTTISNDTNTNSSTLIAHANDRGGLFRSESPGSGFRKFRGDPGEVIGDAEHRRRNLCCALI